MSPAWQNILDEIQRIQHAWDDEGILCWFRGHSSASWPVKSSLHRHIERYLNSVGVSWVESVKIQLLRDEYKGLYRKYQARAWPLLTSSERSDWGIIFSMQHHGIPTRLLDWTRSFACALYFAQVGRNADEDAAIYILNPEGLNSLAYGQQGLHALGETCSQLDGHYHPGYRTAAGTVLDIPTLAVSAFFSNPRMIAQKGTFTMMGDSFQPLEEQFNGELLERGYLKKIILPAETYEDTEQFLDLVGIGHYGYFPDLEGLLKEFKGDWERTITKRITKYRREDK
jgi:hypothetical protein